MKKAYLLDTHVVFELLQKKPETVAWLTDLKNNSQNEIVLGISGFTQIEFIQGKENQEAMARALENLQGFKVFWNKPEESDDIPRLLKDHYHSQRDSETHRFNGNALMDCFIYITAKSNKMIFVTRNIKHFTYATDIEIVDLNKENGGKYRLP